jgi:hemerythrin-like domain-containing protein
MATGGHMGTIGLARRGRFYRSPQGSLSRRRAAKLRIWQTQEKFKMSSMMHPKSAPAPSRAMRSALSILQGEHASHATALKTLTGHLDCAREHSLKLKLEIFTAGLSFIDTFVDQFHHPKEDEFLFRALRQHTSEADQVLSELQFDHAYSTCALKGLKTELDHIQSGRIAELHQFAEAMKRYVQAQFAHMEQEESVVIPLARRLLAEDDWLEIDRAFRANRDPLFGAEHSRKFGILFRSFA